MPCPIKRNKPTQTQQYNKLSTMCGNWTCLCFATDWTYGLIFRGMHKVTVSIMKSVTCPLFAWNSITPTGPFFCQILYFGCLLKFFIKTGKSNRHCTWRSTYLYMILAVVGLFDWDFLWLLSGVQWGKRKSWGSKYRSASLVCCCFHNTNYSRLYTYR
jgi:hypothetical protein